MGCRIGERDLVRAESAFDLYAIDDLRPGPALRGFEDDHRPARPRRVAVFARVLLDLPDLFDRRIERRRHRLVHERRFVALDKNGRPTITAQELFEFLVA